MDLTWAAPFNASKRVEAAKIRLAVLTEGRQNLSALPNIGVRERNATQGLKTRVGEK